MCGGELVLRVDAKVIVWLRTMVNRFNSINPELPKSFWQRTALELHAELERLKARVAQSDSKRAAEQLLTPMQLAVLELIAHGLSNEQIAQQLGVGERTIRTHSHIVFGRLGVSNRTQAALYAWRTGLVTIDDAWATVEEVQRLNRSSHDSTNC